MYDMIPQCGALQDVTPGDPWQPESAARYNAVNDLLRQEPGSPIGGQILPEHSECTITVCNVSNKEFRLYSAVQIETSYAPDEHYLWHRNVRAYGKPVESGGDIVWGVALENIRPGKSGPVQISGAALIKDPLGVYEDTYRENPYAVGSGNVFRKVRNNFIFPGMDGRYHFGKRGARIIWYCKPTGYVLVHLNSQYDKGYTGMFAVLENGDGTLTVKGGETDLKPTWSAGLDPSGTMGFINDTVLKVEGTSGRVIALQATLTKGTWKLEVISVKNSQECYVPGEKIYWELARYSKVGKDGYLEDFQQLWQGGMINFRDRFYIEQ